MVEEAVEDGRGDDRVPEHLAPLGAALFAVGMRYWQEWWIALWGSSREVLPRGSTRRAMSVSIHKSDISQPVAKELFCNTRPCFATSSWPPGAWSMDVPTTPPAPTLSRRLFHDRLTRAETQN